MTREPIRSVVVFAPGSFDPVREPLRAAFGHTKPGWGAAFASPAYSGLLAERIRAGARADVFVSANRRFADALHRDGLAARPRAVAGNRLAVVVRHDLADEVAAKADLVGTGLRVVVPPAATDPLGEYAEEHFARAGVAEAMGRKRTRGEIVSDLAALAPGLARGEVDAGVVYATSLPGPTPAGIGRPLAPPLDLRDRIAFFAAAVGRSAAPHPGAERVVAFLRSPAGQAIFARAGFLPPPTEDDDPPDRTPGNGD